MFTCIRLRKRKQCCEPKIGGEIQLPTIFHLNQACIKFSTCQCVKKYYVILHSWTLLIFFWDGHDFVLKHSILMNVPFIWGMRDIKRSRNLWHKDKSVRINVGWRRKRKKKNIKRCNINYRRKENKEIELELEKVYSSMFFPLQFVMSFYRNKRISMWMKHTNFHVWKGSLFIVLYYAFGPAIGSKFIKHNAWNYLLLHIKMWYCCQEMLSTYCNHSKVTNIKLNLILEEENYFQLVKK